MRNEENILGDAFDLLDSFVETENEKRWKEEEYSEYWNSLSDFERSEIRTAQRKKQSKEKNKFKKKKHKKKRTRNKEDLTHKLHLQLWGKYL